MTLTAPTAACQHRADLLKLRELLRTTKGLAATYHLAYNLLRGLPPRRGFATPKRRGEATNAAFEAAADLQPALFAKLGLTWSPALQRTLQDERRKAALEDFEAACEQGSESIRRRSALRRATRLTPHGASSNALAHGEDAWKRYYLLTSALGRKPQADIQDQWPDWLRQHGPALAKMQLPWNVMWEYLVHHDCGKPLTLVRDEQDRPHFPDHAAKSAQAWARAGGSATACALMAKDMQLHLLPCSEMPAFAKDPMAPSLLLAAWAEIESNADSLFGGRGSDSYKIKAKALCRRAKALCRIWFAEPAEA